MEAQNMWLLLLAAVATTAAAWDLDVTSIARPYAGAIIDGQMTVALPPGQLINMFWCSDLDPVAIPGHSVQRCISGNTVRKRLYPALSTTYTWGPGRSSITFFLSVPEWVSDHAYVVAHLQQQQASQVTELILGIRKSSQNAQLVALETTSTSSTLEETTTTSSTSSSAEETTTETTSATSIAAEETTSSTSSTATTEETTSTTSSNAEETTSSTAAEETSSASSSTATVEETSTASSKEEETTTTGSPSGPFGEPLVITTAHHHNHVGGEEQHHHTQQTTGDGEEDRDGKSVATNGPAAADVATHTGRSYGQIGVPLAIFAVALLAITATLAVNVHRSRQRPVILVDEEERNRQLMAEHFGNDVFKAQMAANKRE